MLDFFDSFRITEIDDGMSQPGFPEVVLGGEDGANHTIADNITVDMTEGRCFVIRDWDRTKRAYRLFLIHANRVGDWPREEEDDVPSWRMRDYLVP
ncbi:hypothetical protein ACFL6X_06945 [Candidatus Latescibacterota bacterium]